LHYDLEGIREIIIKCRAEEKLLFLVRGRYGLGLRMFGEEMVSDVVGWIGEEAFKVGD
jgi:hypothetical protein